MPITPPCGTAVKLALPVTADGDPATILEGDQLTLDDVPLTGDDGEPLTIGGVVAVNEGPTLDDFCCNDLEKNLSPQGLPQDPHKVPTPGLRPEGGLNCQRDEKVPPDCD